MKTPNDTEELVELIKYIDSVRTKEIVQLQEDIMRGKKRLDFLLNYATLPDEDIKLNGVTFTWPKRVGPTLDLAKKRLSQRKTKAQEELKAKILATNEKLDECFEQVNKLQLSSELAEASKRIKSLEEDLKDLSVQITRVNHEEELMEWEKTQFPRYQSALEQLDPYKKLWETYAHFQAEYNKWMQGPFVDLRAETVDEDVNAMWRTIFKLSKSLADQPVPRKVADMLKSKLDKFKTYIPLITTLRNPGLRDRHWKRMAEISQTPISPDPSTTLTKILEMNLSQHLPAFEEISEAASKEFSLERALTNMKGEWADLSFSPIAYLTSGTFILSALDDVQILMDDQILKIQTMRNSPFVKPIEAEVLEWEEKLNLMQNIMDAWLKVQSTWLYLEPVFSSEDIMAQMPKEGKSFRAVDKTWRDIMKTCSENPKILAMTAAPNLLHRLEDSNHQLDIIQKGLNDYLEKKRIYFPRFFFLSNDELLEILSETRDPLRVDPHLKKCFEGINSLTFQDDNQRIIAMCSAENERVKFKEVIEPAKAKGAVEKWLLQVEKIMRISIHEQVGRAMKAYAEFPREKWVLEWPGQVVICVSQIYWTKEVIETLKKDGNKGLSGYREKCNKQLENVVELVRGNLSSMARTTLAALVVIDVHAREVVLQLEEAGVEDENDFEWLSQLRYYWEQDDVMVRMINATIKYGYEYLGNSGRLVITPLTDRCYRTLIGALDLNLGGAPEGPAGTGKTETVKDLAKAIAKQCVVFNCSDGLDFKAMGKLFKGVAAAGAWACLDEFNRIDLEVLSVVAQQILTIQRAVAAKIEKFTFEESQLPLNRTCSVFITMNPGYAGRSELPDNLKALFRPVAMMVPDYALIAEISLYSCGFVDARPLARKIVATYKLCSEQLSSQDHYDYGMRAVKSVLTAAGNLKLKYVGEDERIIMLRSINDINLPKFLQQDIPLFKGITADLFPGVTLPTPDYKDLLRAIEDAAKANKLQVVPSFVEKIIQVYEMMLVRHGFMLVGEPNSGKTASYRVLAEALNSLAAQNINDQKRVQIGVLNPKSITMGQLYGLTDPVTLAWSDGVIPFLFRNFATSTTPDRKWLIFDGPVDAIWIENMNTVLDDNKKLCLTSGEAMKMSSGMSIMFEVMDLAVASPATVSRCGMIYIEADNIGWQALVRSWMLGLPPAVNSDLRDTLETILFWILPPTLAYIKRNCKFMLAAADTNLVSSLLKLITAQLDDVNENVNVEVLRVWLKSFVLFGMVWSVGALVDNDGRAKFDKFLRKLTEGNDSDYPMSTNSNPNDKMDNLFPQEQTVYDYVYVKDVSPRFLSLFNESRTRSRQLNGSSGPTPSKMQRSLSMQSSARLWFRRLIPLATVTCWIFF